MALSLHESSSPTIALDYLAKSLEQLLQRLAKAVVNSPSALDAGDDKAASVKPVQKLRGSIHLGTRTGSSYCIMINRFYVLYRAHNLEIARHFLKPQHAVFCPPDHNNGNLTGYISKSSNPDLVEPIIIPHLPTYDAEFSFISIDQGTSMLFYMRPNGWPEFKDSSTMTTHATIRTFMDMDSMQISVAALIVEIHVKFSKSRRIDLMEEFPQSRSSVTLAILAVVGRRQSGYSAST
ncbi:hypothetical protein COCMIDRAFT_6413 [Bipolaris oryzae ATCC 44560]|uniref:Uncharacterized protein n=1 Tax=Bipolaris oryzae ATCC 44560 TaxID=930090 RepID=W6Z3F0_COCMI|nr:uncharacterized protein COCMIDRAFT_6413 [Bipolaris oryzae ATCC 44560]EUC44248.1 hypothetical protein COCMIDRAFT_6413 [Bipolaris oryzae ATCC 44560]